MAEEYFNDPSKSKSATKNLGENPEGKMVKIKMVDLDHISLMVRSMLLFPKHLKLMMLI